MPTPSIEICILAGGRSTRMGREKSQLRLGGRTLLTHARALATAAGFPARVLRRDLVPRCGPLGGVCTALATTGAGRVLFLSCDMPFVTPDLLRQLTRRMGPDLEAVFAEADGVVGFPFLIRRSAAVKIQRRLTQGKHSLQGLARSLKSKWFRVPAHREWELHNINTPADLLRARQLWREQRVP